MTPRADSLITACLILCELAVTFQVIEVNDARISFPLGIAAAVIAYVTGRTHGQESRS